jgi:phosphoribosylanthranilate isomerase
VRTRVKICGVTRVEDAEVVASAGADFMGLNFWSGSKRCVGVDAARELAAAARAIASVAIVGVFVNAPIDEVVGIADSVELDVIQLHGDESQQAAASIGARTQRWLWKAIGVPAGEELDLEALDRWPADALLLDAATPQRGGSGVTIDWATAAHAARRRRVVLAGGLTPENVTAAVRAVAPWGVDVASGVERAPGVKDAVRVAAFVAAAREGST